MPIAGVLFLFILVSNLLIRSQSAQYRIPFYAKVAEFCILVPALGLTIDAWSKMIAWIFFIGDNHSWFWDLGRYYAAAAGIILAGVVSFGVRTKTYWQWPANLGCSLLIVLIWMIVYGNQFLPRWIGTDAHSAANRFAQQVFVTDTFRVKEAPYAVLEYRYSPWDRTFLVMGKHEAIGRVVVRPYLPGYWIQKEVDRFSDATIEYGWLRPDLRGVPGNHPNVDSLKESLKSIVKKYPETKIAQEAEEWLAALAKRRPS